MANGTGTTGGDYTTYTSYKAGVLIWQVVPPILILLGTVGNCLSIYVLTRKSIRVSTTALYLTVLAFSDLAVLYSGLLRQWLIYLFDTDVRHVSQTGCKINIWLVYCSLDFSAWILIVVTLERVISAWLPHSARNVCTKKSAVAFLLTIGVFVLALNSHLLYGMVFKNVYDELGNVISVSKCEEIDTAYYEFFNKVWPWVDLCAFCVIPFSVIVIGNSLILVKVIKSHKKTKSRIVPTVAVNTHRVQSSSHGKHSSMTTMLFTLNIVFLVSTSPISIYNIGYTYWMTGASDEKIAELDLWWAIVNMLMYTNNSLNFLLYCLSGTKFRQEVINLFCKRYKSGRNSTNSAISKYTRTRFDTPSKAIGNSSPDLSRLSPGPDTKENGVEQKVVKLTQNANTLHPDMALNFSGKTSGDNTVMSSF